MKIKTRIDLINRLLTLKRHDTVIDNGYEGSGDAWYELVECEKGKFVKFKNIKKIVRDLKKGK